MPTDRPHPGLIQPLDATWATLDADQPVTQITAGLRYIQERYGDPGGAAWRWLRGGIDLPYDWAVQDPDLR